MKPMKRFAKIFNFEDAQLLVTIRNSPRVKASCYQLHAEVQFRSDTNLTTRVSALCFKSQLDLNTAFERFNLAQATEVFFELTLAPNESFKDEQE